MKKSLKLLSAALLVGAAGFVASCGTGGDAVTSAGDSSGSVETLKTASLRVAVKFPNSQISPQYIDNDVKCVEVVFQDKNEFRKYLALTPDSPSGTLDDLTPGSSLIEIVAVDGVGYDYDGTPYCDGSVIDVVRVKALLKEGPNQLTATLISPARWIFVDNNNNPISITFNKIKTDSTERIWAFDLKTTGGTLLYNDYNFDIPQTASYNFDMPGGRTSYYINFKGNDLFIGTDNDDYFACSDTDNDGIGDTCATYAHYYNQFVGPNTSSNVFESNSIYLNPLTEGNDQYARFFFVFGTKPGYEGYYGYSYYDYKDESYIYDFEATQADNTDVIQDIASNFGYTSVVSPNTMLGTILEILVKSEQKGYGCSFDRAGTDTFTCPANVGSLFDGSYYQLGPASINITKNGISTLALNDNDCYTDVTIEEKRGQLVSILVRCNQDNDGNYTICDYNIDGDINDNDDMNGDGIVNKDDDYYVYHEWRINGDICVYPFRAKAQPIPKTTLDLTIQ